MAEHKKKNKYFNILFCFELGGLKKRFLWVAFTYRPLLAPQISTAADERRADIRRVLGHRRELILIGATNDPCAVCARPGSDRRCCKSIDRRSAIESHADESRRPVEEGIK